MATALAAGVTPAARAAAPVAAPLTVSTSSGRLHGFATARDREFLGVRYAQAPTGPRRWTMPVPARRAAGTIAATKPGPDCAQAGSAPGAGATASTKEDCLFLNVTTPRRLVPGERLPVLVWWHGGGYTSGSGAAYDARRLASRGHVMVVTVNYRLGVFGYLSLPGLAGSGDFGLADQILATRWAKQNAAAFGGDPDNITVFGQSSGAMSACAFLTSPAAVGLVDKVALASGSCLLRWPRGGLLPGTPGQSPYLALADAERLGSSEAGSIGCRGGSALACLRGKPVRDLLKIFGDFSNVLAFHTPLLPANPAAAVRAGRFLDVPILSGGTHDEERAFVGGAQQTERYYTAASYPRLLQQAFGARAGAVAARYPLGDFRDAAVAFATVITDASWACPTLRGNAEFAAHDDHDVYAYEFADPNAPNVNGITTPEVPPRAAHASDIPYLFDLVGQNLLTTDEQRTLAGQMIDYWSSFARTGVPVAAGTPAWAPFTGPDGATQRLGPSISDADIASEHHCSFWS